MPTYEYLCGSCEHKFEKFQSITANSLRKCPKCSKMELKRLIGTGAGVIFKGSGFYETDYRSDGYKQAAKRETPKSDNGAGKKETATSDAGKTSDKSPVTSTAKTSDSSGNSKKGN